MSEPEDLKSKLLAAEAGRDELLRILLERQMRGILNHIKKICDICGGEITAVGCAQCIAARLIKYENALIQIGNNNDCDCGAIAIARTAIRYPNGGRPIFTTEQRKKINREWNELVKQKRPS